MTLQSGRLGNYEIIRHLGSEIYLARDGEIERVLAVLELDDTEDARLYDELARCAELQHPVVVPVVDLFAEDAKNVLVYERIAGVSLREIGPHVRGQKLPPTAVWHLGHELAAALAEAHALGIVHGWLEPEHVVVSWQAQVGLIGLGANVVLEQRKPGPFAAPEVRAGAAVTARANTYSLAAMLWWLLTDRYPPTEGTPEPVRNLREDVPSDLALILDDALAPDPDKRIHCGELAEVLEAAKEDGQDELHWHMEVIRAAGDWGLDEPPSSALFPSSRRGAAAPASEPAASEPPMATPRPIRSRRGIGKRSFRSTKERTPPPVEPQQPVQPPDPPPAEPPPSPSPPPVVPSVRPPDISNEPLSSTLAPPMGASRRHIVIWLASTVTAFAAGVFVSQSFDAPPAPAATETAQPAPPPPEPKKPPPAPKPKPSATAPPLAPGYGHLVAESSVQGSGVYVFGELAGPPNQPLPVKCDRLAFVRLGTVPMRHWYTPGRTVEVRCGEVTRITLEPVPGSR